MISKRRNCSASRNTVKQMFLARSSSFQQTERALGTVGKSGARRTTAVWSGECLLVIDPEMAEEVGPREGSD